MLSLFMQGEGVGSAELLVWMGDFNYRIVGERDDVVSSIRRFLLRGDTGSLQQLLAKVRTPTCETAPCNCPRISCGGS